MLTDRLSVSTIHRIKGVLQPPSSGLTAFRHCSRPGTPPLQVKFVVADFARMNANANVAMDLPCINRVWRIQATNLHKYVTHKNEQ